MIEASIQWIFINVVFALIALIIGFVVGSMMEKKNIWVKLLKDGELFVFSSTMTASSIDTLLSKPHSVWVSLTFYLLILLLIFSSAMLFLAIYAKFDEKTGQDKEGTIADVRKITESYCKSSVSCALMAITLGYLTFVIK